MWSCFSKHSSSISSALHRQRAFSARFRERAWQLSWCMLENISSRGMRNHRFEAYLDYMVCLSFGWIYRVLSPQNKRDLKRIDNIQNNTKQIVVITINQKLEVFFFFSLIPSSSSPFLLSPLSHWGLTLNSLTCQVSILLLHFETLYILVRPTSYLPC